MTDKIINGIDVSEYFTNHYDNSGKLYAVEYKGNPLELQNAIKRLQEENEKLKAEIAKFRWDNPYYVLYNNVVGQRDNLERENEELKKRQITKNGFICDCEQNAKYIQTLEEIRNILCNGRTFYEGYFDTPNLSRTDEAIKVINEVLK